MVGPIILLLLVCAVSSEREECVSRDFGESSTVCVCDANHCDTLPRPEKLEPGNFHIITSSKDGLRFDQDQGSFKSSSVEEEINILLNTDDKFQTILGWGGAFTDAFGINVASLDEEAQDKLLNSYFSENGIEYSLCRVPIGGTDFSLRGYSYNDGDVDLELKNFKIADEDFQYKIPNILKAKNLTNDNLRLFASAWTAPKWMKTNGEYNGYGFLKEDMYQSWASYFVKFLDGYADEGIDFWGITTGNEPNTAYIIGVQINTVGWTPETLGTWVLENLGPTIRNSSHTDIKIMILDDQRLYLPWYVSQAFFDNQTRNFIDGIAFHWYINPVVPADVLSTTHEEFPEKFILSTEACNVVFLEYGPVILGSWERGEYYSLDIIQDMWHWTSGWIDWNMALSPEGGPTYISNFVDSPVIVNATANEFYKQPMFYHLGHFTKFVPRDSVRVGTTISGSTTLNVVAFQRPDDGIVVVILNTDEDNVNIGIADGLGATASLTIGARSITTLLWW